MTSQKERVYEMINQYVKSINLDLKDSFNEEKQSWNWRTGSARIQVYIQTVPLQSGSSREYLRIFSPLLQVPQKNELAFYRHLLELNDTKLGVKLSVMPNSNWVYATYERDIRGIDYHELATCIADLEWWADKLDDELKAQFAD